MAQHEHLTRPQSSARSVNDLVFVAFNSRVVALDRYTGELAWEWKSPEGRGYVSLLLDGDRLIVSVIGYMYCLDPLYGGTVWANPLKGMGTGVACLASSAGASNPGAQASAQAQQQAAAANVAVTAGASSAAIAAAG